MDRSTVVSAANSSMSDKSPSQMGFAVTCPPRALAVSKLTEVPN
jgi:hypothetical protein